MRDGMEDLYRLPAFVGESRAENARPLGAHGALGDPERWGGSASVVLAQPGAGATVEVIGSQLVRAQCLDLVARSWDLACEWEILGSIAGDVLLADLLITWGIGQTSGVAVMRINGTTGVLRPGDLVSGATNGSFSSGLPLPALALAIVPRLRVTSPGAAHSITLNVTAGVAPRVPA